MEKGIALNLRHWRKSDIRFLAKHASKPEIWQHMSNRFPTSDSEIEIWIEKACPTHMLPTALAIEFNSEVRGSIAAILKQNEHRKDAELGYWLSDKYWNRGIMTTAVIKMTDYLFENFDIERIYAEVLENNIASIRVLEKSGFSMNPDAKIPIRRNGETIYCCFFEKLRDK